MHASKKANKKSDMRVSCEAIPEEMCGTSPQPHPQAQDQTQAQAQAHAGHPHLMTYNSDPGMFGMIGIKPTLPLELNENNYALRSNKS